jgi:hypothetical protein
VLVVESVPVLEVTVVVGLADKGADDGVKKCSVNGGKEEGESVILPSSEMAV